MYICITYMYTYTHICTYTIRYIKYHSHKSFFYFYLLFFYYFLMVKINYYLSPNNFDMSLSHYQSSNFLSEIQLEISMYIIRP